MKKGDVVKIYEKPFSQEGYEGEVKLIKMESKLPEAERWEVKFPDGDIVSRVIFIN